MGRKLSEKQELFLDYLFHPDVRGDFAKAKEMAGYSPNVSTQSIVESLKEEIMDGIRTFLSQVGPEAAFGLHSVITDPTQLGVQNKLKAITEVLDRIGVVKTEKIELEGNAAPVLFLPPKDDESE